MLEFNGIYHFLFICCEEAASPTNVEIKEENNYNHKESSA